ncbi:MAG: hypothetical protein IKE89_03490 [Bacilli bacterium]|nr:hypothetical protein [Bacilli bacterium]MBR2711515.1 hypothetical protein [Bacilli bacterium]
MSEEEIRLDQTKKVFDMLALLIKNNETCSYRFLIYDMLGFDESAYVELLSGMTITNKLVECETQKEVIDKIKEILKSNINFYEENFKLSNMTAEEFKKEHPYTLGSYDDSKNLLERINELLEEIE